MHLHRHQFRVRIAEIARTVAIPYGSISEVLACNWFTKEREAYVLTQQATDYLRTVDRG